MGKQKMQGRKKFVAKSGEQHIFTFEVIINFTQGGFEELESTGHLSYKNQI